jgi:hypothetical protein
VVRVPRHVFRRFIEGAPHPRTALRLITCIVPGSSLWPSARCASAS